MHSVRPRCKSDVEPIVDQNACSGAVHGRYTRRHQTHQRSPVEIAFADLHQVNAFARRVFDARNQRLITVRPEQPAVGNQTKNRLQVERLAAETLQRSGFGVGLAREKNGYELADS